MDASEVALVPDGSPGAGGTVLLLQKWSHDATAWESLPVDQQERVMGRTKDASVELEDKAPDSHVARNDQDRFGKIFRRNMAYGTVTDHGTMFVGFSAEQRRLAAMLESMAGVPDGVRDALTTYARPLTGAYYVVVHGRAATPRRGGRRVREVDFDAAYAGAPPWDIGRPQPAFLGLAGSGTVRGVVLDVGCGTGEHALMAAGMGLPATGVDTSGAAIDLAARKAETRGLHARFLVWDALDLPGMGARFDTVLDSGLFHVFDDEERARYVRSLLGAGEPGGRVAILAFSDRVPGQFGPRRVSRDEIETSFTDGWEILSIEPATMDVTFTPTGIPAWLAVIART